MTTTFGTINNTLRSSVRHSARTATGGCAANGITFGTYGNHLTPKFGSRQRRRYSFKMIVNNEQRFQYVYFVLSGVVASALLALIYVCLWTTAQQQLREDIKGMQQVIELVKPAAHWTYNNSWQYIGNETQHQQIYSAYFDQRIDILDIGTRGNDIPIGSFRIFAIFPRKLYSQIYCLIRFEDFTLKEIEPQEAIPMHEDHGCPYVPYTIMCPYFVQRDQKSVRLPQSVALTISSNWLSYMSPTFIPISYPPDMKQIFSKSKPVLSVCVGPLQSRYDNALRIVEFVEMYRILGATHFYFYINNATEDALRVVEYYRQKGLSTVLNWRFDPQHLEDMHYAGIMAQINDCIYRAMIVDNYRYATVVDLDEILQPYKHNSLGIFLRQCDEGRTSAFIFRNAFFFKKDSNDTFSVPPHVRNRLLYTQTKVRRTVELMPHYTRSKYIANTRAVIEAGNHQLWREADGFSDSLVHASVGLLHHYRDKCINCKQIMMVDYSARRFGSLIWDQVDETCLVLFLERKGICPMGFDF